MSKRYDAMIPRPGKDNKTYWHRIGTGFLSDKGQMGIILDSLPIPDKDGRVSIQLFEPKPKGEAAATPAKSSRPVSEELNDDVPF